MRDKGWRGCGRFWNIGNIDRISYSYEGMRFNELKMIDCRGVLGLRMLYYHLVHVKTLLSRPAKFGNLVRFF